MRHRLEQMGLLFFFLAWPWQTRLFLDRNPSEYLSVSLYASGLLALAVVGLSAAGQWQRWRIFLAAHRWLLLGCAALVAGSMLVAPDKPAALARAGAAALYGMLAIAVAFSRLSSAQLRRWFTWGLVPVALLAIMQFALQASWPTKWLGLALHQSSDLGQVVVETADGERWLRAYGSFDHPNILGGIMAVALLFLIVQMIKGATCPGGDKRSYFEYAAALLFATALYFSFSRAAWLGFAAGLAVIAYFAWRGKFQLPKCLLVGCLSLVAVLSVFYGQLVTARSDMSSRLESKSAAERVSYFAEARQLIIADPLFGVGMGNYIPALMSLKPSQSAWSYQPVHNAYILFVVETGWLGIFFAAMVGRRFFQQAWQPENVRYAAPLACAAAVMMLFDHWWWSLHAGLVFSGLLLGISVRLLQENKQ